MMHVPNCSLVNPLHAIRRYYVLAIYLAENL